MLGDNPEKSKNPLKKAMRRRNAKTVQFTAPTYYEPSENEYSSEEEGEEVDFLQGPEPQQVQDQHEDIIQEEAAAVEPLNVRAAQKEEVEQREVQTETVSQQSIVDRDSQEEKPRSSEEIFERQGSIHLCMLQLETKVSQKTGQLPNQGKVLFAIRIHSSRMTLSRRGRSI